MCQGHAGCPAFLFLGGEGSPLQSSYPHSVRPETEAYELGGFQRPCRAVSSKWASAEGGVGGHGAGARPGYKQHDELALDSSVGSLTCSLSRSSLYVISGSRHALSAFYEETDVEWRSHCPRSQASQRKSSDLSPGPSTVLSGSASEALVLVQSPVVTQEPRPRGLPGHRHLTGSAVTATSGSMAEGAS